MQVQTFNRDVFRQRQAEIAQIVRLIRDLDLFSFVVKNLFIDFRSLCILFSVL